MIESRTFDLVSFDRIKIANGIRAVVTQGEVQSVRLETTRKGLLNRIVIMVEDGQLHAKHDGNILDALVSGGFLVPSNLGRHATLHIVVPELVGVNASMAAVVTAGSVVGETVDLGVSTHADVTIDSAKAETMFLKVSSTGKLQLSGACDRLDMKFSHAGRILALELACTDAVVDGDSGAYAEVTVLGKVTGSIRQAATIRFAGNPDTSDVKTSSSGLIIE